MRYESLDDLRRAFAAGELDDGDGGQHLVVDNDGSHLCVGDRRVYAGGGPGELVHEALDLLGIPNVAP